MATTKSVHVDALRGAAVLSVVVYHYVYCFGLARYFGWPDFARTITGYGWAGVDVFFVLSAYLLANALLKHRDDEGLIVTFYRRRILRILPMYFVVFSAAVLLAPLFDPKAWLFDGLAPSVIYLTFTQNFWAGLQTEFTGQFLSPTWSLAVEEHFYLFLPLLILNQPDRRIVKIAVAFIVFAPLSRLLVAQSVGAIAPYTWTFCRLDSFGWGLLIALAPRLDGDARRFIRQACIAAATAGLLWSIAEIVWPTGQEHPVTPTTLFAAAAVTLVVRRGAPARGPSAAVRLFAYFGERCFSIYLLHIPVAGLMAMLFGLRQPDAFSFAAALSLIFTAPTMLWLASMTYQFIERPFIEYGERVAAYRRPAAAAA